MKKIILFAAFAAVMAGCAKNDVKTAVLPEDAVSFGAYTGRVQTKAGVTDDINLDALKEHGFGVFATFTGTDKYEASDNNFMYNQKVAYGTSAWEYSPIRYWPNPTGGQEAKDQYVSFFAYAPYCEPGASETTGIKGFDIDATSKHNLVYYAFAPNAANVDLLWGYKTGADFTDGNIDNDINIDLTRSANTIKFTFRHLLSKLAGSQEGITDPDAPGYKANGLIIVANPTAGPTDDYIAGTIDDFGTATGTKITISKIILESAPADGVLTDINGNIVSYATEPQTATLDLYTGKFTLDSDTPKALQFRQEISADATEVAAGASELAEWLKEVPGVTDFSAVNKGVTKQPVNAYKDEANPIILIPGTAPVLNVTITYTVRTYDAKLPKTFTEVPQTVFKQIKFPTIEENKKYNLKMILGLNDAAFEATVEDWSLGRADISGPAGVPDGVIDDYDDVTVDLPANL